MIPLIPYFFGAAGTVAIVASIGCAAVGLFTIGMLITLLTGRGALLSGTRQLAYSGLWWQL